MAIEVRKPTEEEINEAQNWPKWEKEVSEFPWSYGEKETCLILSGSAEVRTADGETADFNAGDWVVFPEGLECTWTIKEGISKRYKFGE
jgi:uncharacterized protein